MENGRNDLDNISYELYKNKAISAEHQIRELYKIISAQNKTLSKLKSPRYIIGTALFDMLRHPLHPSKPAKQILRVIKKKLAKKKPLRQSLPGQRDIPEMTDQQESRQILPSEGTNSRKDESKTWVLMCPAPEKNNTFWGDYHFCVSLSEALKRKGQRAEIRLYEKWQAPLEADIVLVIRGRWRYRPHRKKNSNTLYVMWNISHPEDVSDREYSSYDIVFVASKYFANILKERLSVPVYPLLQCTDTSRFFMTEQENAMPRKGLLFVGNGRIEGRLCVNWAAASEYSLRVFGQNWYRSLDNHKKYVVADSIENEKIRDEFMRVQATLNNHWSSMKAYQFINNRVFDALACGLPVISDSFDELKALFPDEILYYEDRASFFDCLNELGTNYDTIKKKAELAGERVRKEHSFDIRADYLISAVRTAQNTAEIRTAEIEEDHEKWTIVLLWKQNDSGLYGRRHEMLMKYFAEDERIGKIIMLDRPIAQTELDKYAIKSAAAPYSKDHYILQRTNEKRFGRVVSEKIVQYNYISPRKLGYLEDDYREYFRHILAKEQVGEGKVALWVCPTVFEYKPVMSELNADLLIADFIDDEREFTNKPAYKQKITENYRDFLIKSDYVFCNCENVKQTLTELCPWKDIHVVSNGAEPATDVKIDYELPERMKDIPRPIIGYVGHFSSRFDVELINYLSDRHPEWHFVLIGSAHLDERISEWNGRENIHLLDIVPYDELPAYISNFDVAIMPHLCNALSASMNPLKLYVYAQYKKPIVCTRVPNIEEIRPLARIADNYEEFEEMVRQSLSEGSITDDDQAYRDFIERENWRKRRDEIFKIIFDEM